MRIYLDNDNSLEFRKKGVYFYYWMGRRELAWGQAIVASMSNPGVESGYAELSLASATSKKKEISFDAAMAHFFNSLTHFNYWNPPESAHPAMTVGAVEAALECFGILEALINESPEDDECVITRCLAVLDLLNIPKQDSDSSKVSSERDISLLMARGTCHTIIGSQYAELFEKEIAQSLEDESSADPFTKSNALNGAEHLRQGLCSSS